MPLRSKAEARARLGKQVDDLSDEELEVFLKAFNRSAYGGGSESKAFSEAHAAARGRAGSSSGRRRRRS